MIKSRTFFLMGTLLVMGFGLSACNTIGGAGKDVENAGEAVQDAAY